MRQRTQLDQCHTRFGAASGHADDDLQVEEAALSEQ
jgi:hypothetical protein